MNKVANGTETTYPRSCPICGFGPCTKGVEVTDKELSKYAYKTTKNASIIKIAKLLCGPRIPLPLSYYKESGITLEDLQDIRWYKLSSQEQNGFMADAKLVQSLIEKENEWTSVKDCKPTEDGNYLSVHMSGDSYSTFRIVDGEYFDGSGDVTEFKNLNFDFWKKINPPTNTKEKTK